MKIKIVLICTMFVLEMLPGGAQEKTKSAKINTPMKTSSGLEYTITKKGNGKKPKTGDKVVVHYTGKLTNDTVFDSSVRRNQPFTFQLGVGQVIKGWDEGIALLQVGDKATFKIPSTLGYGSSANGKIPANAILIFDVELLDVIEKVAPKAFDISGKEVKTTASGLQYIVVNKGNGARAMAGKTVSVHYTGFLEDGSIFDSSVERGEPIQFPLGQGRVIPGWDEGIALMNIGDKYRLIIPYNLAYGEAGRHPIIPAKAKLTFDVELINVQ